MPLELTFLFVGPANGAYKSGRLCVELSVLFLSGVPARKSHIPDLVNKVGRVYHTVFRVAKKKFEKQSKVLG